MFLYYRLKEVGFNVGVISIEKEKVYEGKDGYPVKGGESHLFID
ncbi:MAG TPA: hypothetical protein VK071_03095 [Tissierellales bacterium]|nr:hypothetical protein [Tissierellales bacterium]